MLLTTLGYGTGLTLYVIVLFFALVIGGSALVMDFVEKRVNKAEATEQHARASRGNSRSTEGPEGVFNEDNTSSP